MRRHACGLLVVLALGLSGARVTGQERGPLQFTPPGPGQPPDIAFYGTFTIDMPATVAARQGQPLALQTLNVSDSFTWIFTPERDGLRMAVYASYPAPQPDRSYFARLDGQPYPDPHGAGRGLGPCVGDCQEFVRLIPVNRYTVAREVVTKGQYTERVFWSVSTDGKTLANVSVVPEDPTQVTVMIFDRVADAPKATAAR